MNQEDATKVIIEWLRNPDHGEFGSYGYDVYLPHLLRKYLRRQTMEEEKVEQTLSEWMPDFYAAAWDLCRRGIIRPGVYAYQAQSTEGGNAGDGYSITPFGRTWIEESDLDSYVPTEPERFATMLKPFHKKFGPGFGERAQEAIRCYGAHAYLACCAMCGAASESILLATAIEKTNDEQKVIKMYSGAMGRSRIENIIIGQAPARVRREFRGLTTLLKYWRDTSAHGHKTAIGDNEAYTSLAMLLRFAIFTRDDWVELTK